MANRLRRLLQDVGQLGREPYPNIKLVTHDILLKVCLILYPEAREPVHIGVQFHEDYPIKAPKIIIRTQRYCVARLSTNTGWKPAYTLRGIAIKLLSFTYDCASVDSVRDYRQDIKEYGLNLNGRMAEWHCGKCGFGDSGISHHVSEAPFMEWLLSLSEDEWNTAFQAGDMLFSDQQTNMGVGQILGHTGLNAPVQDAASNKKERWHLLNLPDKVLLGVFEELDTKGLFSAATLCRRFAEFIHSKNLVQLSRLHCAHLKKSVRRAKLGFAIVKERASPLTSPSGLKPEFKYLCQQAFEHYQARRSTRGKPLKYWLPLALTLQHWNLVRLDADAALTQLAAVAETRVSPRKVIVICDMVHNIVIRHHYKLASALGIGAIRHTSEEALRQYFDVVHLLFCLAAEQDDMVTEANRRVTRFLDGWTSKAEWPNLGEVFVIALISDQGLTEDLTRVVIWETIIRAVADMLDYRGTSWAELSYLEPSEISEYRLQRTFDAFKGHYRLLMMQSIFSRSVRSADESIFAVRDRIFNGNGAPSAASAERLARDIYHAWNVQNFFELCGVMGVNRMPTRASLTKFLRWTINESVNRNWSRWPFTQSQALALRRVKEPNVEVAEGLDTNSKVPRRHQFEFRGPKYE